MNGRVTHKSLIREEEIGKRERVVLVLSVSVIQAHIPRDICVT
jgi:hypothetical protein